MRKDREQIDADLLRGRSLRDIARDMLGQPGTSKSALERHRAHVAEKLAKAHEDEEIGSAHALAAMTKEIETGMRRYARQAERSGDLKTAIAAMHGMIRMVAIRLSVLAALPPASREPEKVVFTVDISKDDGEDVEEEEAAPGPRLVESAADPDEDPDTLLI